MASNRKDEKDAADRPAEARSEGQPGNGQQQAAPERARRASASATESATRAAESTARAAESGLSQASEATRRGTEQMRSLMGASTRAYRDIADFSRGDVDMFMQTGARLAKGFQDVGWEMMQFTQTSLRMGLQAANDMMTCRSVEDVIQVQRNYLKESMDTLLQESVRLFEISSHVASDTVTPLTDRLQGGEAAARR